MFLAMNGDNNRWFVDDDKLIPMSNKEGFPKDLSHKTIFESLSYRDYIEDTCDCTISPEEWCENIYEYLEYHSEFVLFLEDIKKWKYWNFTIKKYLGIEQDDNFKPILSPAGNCVERNELIPMWKWVEQDGFWDMVSDMEFLENEYGCGNCRAIFWYDG